MRHHGPCYSDRTVQKTKIWWLESDLLNAALVIGSRKGLYLDKNNDEQLLSAFTVLENII